MTNVNSSFENDSKKANGSRSLPKTQELTNLAESIAADIMKKIDADYETYKVQLEESKSSHEAMDNLITTLYDLTKVDVEFLKEIEEPVIDGMLKSQQSKRSRAKSKTMTLDNYLSMMTGAVAEALIRTATGKAKSSSSRRVGVNYTDDDLKELAQKQDELRKEIRNIQSKKSIMKSKADFDENSEAYQQLLEAEEKLKAIRVGGTDSLKQALGELFGDKDVDSMKSAEVKELLKAVADKLK